MKTAKNVGARTPRWAQRELQTAGVSAVDSWATCGPQGNSAARPSPLVSTPARARSQKHVRGAPQVATASCFAVPIRHNPPWSMVQKSRASPCASSQRRSLPQQNSNSTRRADSLHRSHTSPWYVYRVSNVRLCTQSQRRGQSQYRLDSCVASLQRSVSVERGSHSVRAHPRNTPRQLTSPCTLYARQPRQQIRALQATGAQEVVAARTPQRPTCRRAQQAT